MRRWLIALTLVLALVGAGCSKDNKRDTAKSDKTSTKSDDKKGDDKSSDDKSDDKSSDDKSSGKGGKFCDVWKGYDDDFADVDELDPTAPNLEELGGMLGELEEAFEQLSDIAPDEIADDLELVMGVGLKAIEVIVEAEGDFTKIDPSSLASMESEEITAATERLNRYMLEECGITDAF